MFKHLFHKLAIRFRLFETSLDRFHMMQKLLTLPLITNSCNRDGLNDVNHDLTLTNFGVANMVVSHRIYFMGVLQVQKEGCLIKVIIIVGDQLGVF